MVGMDIVTGINLVHNSNDNFFIDLGKFLEIFLIEIAVLVLLLTLCIGNEWFGEHLSNGVRHYTL